MSTKILCTYELRGLDNVKCDHLYISSPPLMYVWTTVLPAKSDNDAMFCLQSYQGLISDRSLVCRIGLIHK